MRKLPWLVYADDASLARSATVRTERAATDLAAIAAAIDGYLVLEDAVDIAFNLEARHLPPGTLDLRDGDPLALALVDVRAVVVSAGGIMIGTPIERDPRWAELGRLGRTRVLLGSSALSGVYFGARVLPSSRPRGDRGRSQGDRSP